MEKEKRKDINITGCLHSGEGSNVYTLDDGRLYKVYNPIFIESCDTFGDSVDARIDAFDMLKGIDEVNIPISKVINDDGSCNSYTMGKVDGLDANSYEDTLTIEDRANLELYRDLYCKIETVIKKMHRLGVINPDLLTLDNIFILPDGSIKFIDVDSFQLPGFHTLAMSTSLGNPLKYFNPKYMDEFMVFNKELDKTSLVMLYFLWTFHIDFNQIGYVNPLNGHIINFDELFNTINLDDPDIIRKVKSTIEDNSSGCYFGSCAKKIAEQYSATVMRNPLNMIFGGNTYVKTLKRK